MSRSAPCKHIYRLRLQGRARLDWEMVIGAESFHRQLRSVCVPDRYRCRPRLEASHSQCV